MTYPEFWKRLTALYGEGEAKAIARMVYEVRYGLTLADLLMGRDTDAPQDSLEQAVQRLEQGEPVQYVLGEAEFFGRRFHVEPGVLIPRPETAELCQWVIEEATHHSPHATHRILDIGTGSGCIAITLALELPQADVTAWDISEEALGIARRNAQQLGADVTFEQHDILSPLTAHHTPFTTIVSNPPYICRKEKDQMQRNVLEHEPALALFVPDNDPLLFYRAIAHFAKEALVPEGLLFFEINPTYEKELTTMLQNTGYMPIQTKTDQYGKPRMLKARKK